MNSLTHLLFDILLIIIVLYDSSWHREKTSKSSGPVLSCQDYEEEEEDDELPHNEKLLLRNVLNTLERLYDRLSSARDVWVLLIKTGEALRYTPHYPEFVRPTAELEALIKIKQSPEAERDQALLITDDLRKYLAKLPLF
jgi:hypothetical protein